MRIVDQNGNEMHEDALDYDRGYLVEDSLFVCHHDAVEAVEEQGHWETIAEYPNGGKDVEWVVDVEVQQAAEAWDEYEDVLRFVLYTAEELAELEAERKRAEEQQARLDALITGGVTWDDLAAALAEGVNSI